MLTPTEFDNTYARLPERFFSRLAPTPVGAPRLLALNAELARELGFDPEQLASADGLSMLSGNEVVEGADPIAMAYAGFQFGNWVPQLGDGRALLLGEVIDREGVRRDLQLKGSGPTPYSRRGDGRAALGPVLREYIVGEAMAALGVPSTRALAAVATGEIVARETPQPGAVLTRVARSHVRVGTFQYFAGQGDVDGLQTLADYVIGRHYPDAAEADNPVLALLDAVIDRQARLVSQWQHLGFIHGVMNTDNMSIAGETIDYGPCAFMDFYHPDTVYSSIDRMGRYAYRNQPPIAHWNLASFAQALLPIIAGEEEEAVALATPILEGYPDRYEVAYRRGMQQKLGLVEERAGDVELADDLLKRMADNEADFTLTFRGLAGEISGPNAQGDGVAALFGDSAAFEEWAVRWRERVAGEGVPHSEIQKAMNAVNPAYIPRNHLVEEVIRAAVDREDFEPFERLVEVTRLPYEERPGLERFTMPPRPDQVVHATFCGT